MQETEIYHELASIRALMSRSAKFLSLNGLSGIMAGFYALAGAYIAYGLIYTDSGTHQNGILWKACLTGGAVLFISLLTATILTIRKARKTSEKVWSPVSKRFLLYLLTPLATGGAFIIILLARAEYDLIAAACLIFYGLALVAGSHYTFSDVKWLGLSQITTGLFAAAIPEHGLLLWVLGFGFLHIIYGTVMHFKYDR